MKRSSVKRHLFAGLIVIAPVTATGFVLWWIFQALDGLLGRFLYPTLSWFVGRDIVIPGLGLAVLFGLLVGIGWLAERAIGSRVVAWWHNTLERIPLTRRIYIAVNRIVRTVFGEESRPFNEVVLVEWPAPGRWALGFLSAPSPDVMRQHVPDAVTVFIPKVPNLATGFVVVVPRSLVIQIDMTIDQAFTFILSAGAVRPETDAELGTVSAAPPPVERMS